MRGSRLVVLACVLLCAFAFAGFAHSAQTETPGKVVLSPKDPTVTIGKTLTQDFTATVYDTKGAKIATHVDLTWTLDAAATTAGFSIDQNGVLSVPPDNASPGTFAKAVTAAVTATPNVSGTARLQLRSILLSPGVFLLEHSLAIWGCATASLTIISAIDALPSSFAGLIIDNTPGTIGYIQFNGSIHKETSVSASFKNTADNSTITLTGTLSYPDGIASVMSGKWSSTDETSGVWTTTLATTPGAGGKVGTWEITATKSPKAAGLTGPFAAIFEDDGTTVAAVALTKVNGELLNGISVPGTWNSDDVIFPSFAEGGSATNASTNATGAYVLAHKAATGNMLSAGSNIVGTWKLSDIK